MENVPQQKTHNAILDEHNNKYPSAYLPYPFHTFYFYGLHIKTS